MKNTLVYLAMAVFLAACHGKSGTLQRKDQQQYDVVQEGQASGVTSTINAPGETVPPPTPMTGTNADTTSDFTLPQVSTSGTAPGQPGTIAGTLPQPSPGSMVTGYPTDTAARPQPAPRPATTTTRTPPRTETSLEGPPPSTSTVPPDTDTAPPPPPSTDSSSTQPNDSDKKHDKDKDKDNPPATTTDTQPSPATTT